MNILIIGEEKRADELMQKLPVENLKIEHFIVFGGSYLSKYDVIFDLNFDDNWQSLNYFATLQKTPIFVGAVKKQLAQVIHEYPNQMNCRLIGMNTLPTFINRPKMEFSVFMEKDVVKRVKLIADEFGWEYMLVEDRVGMVTPRIIFMIINEASFTLQEGTASVEDIDKAMKLGTNYPYGPFEWADKVGVKEVYETLKAIHEDTGDERYRVCSLLKTQYLKNELFYPAQKGQQKAVKGKDGELVKT